MKFNCLLSLALFSMCLAIATGQDDPDREEFREVVIDGVTWLIRSDGSRAMLDSETGFAEVEFNGSLVTTQVLTPQRRLAATRVKNAESYVRFRNRFYGGSMSANIAHFETRIADAVMIASMILSNDDQIHHLEMTDEQKSQLQDMVEQFHSRMEEYPLDIDGATEDDLAWARLNRRAATQEYSQKMSELFADEQLKKIASWSPARHGVVKSLTETPLGDALELSDEQKMQIRDEVEEAIEKLKLEVEETRATILERVGDALDEDQREKLKKHLGNMLQQQIVDSSTDKLIQTHDYDLEKDDKVEKDF